MLLEKCRADERNVGEPWNSKVGAFGQFFLHVGHARERRKSGTEQRQREPGGVLIGVEPDHQHPEQCGKRCPRRRARDEAHRIAAGVHHGGKASDSRAQHHALRAQVHDAGFFVDEQPERGDGEHRASVQCGSEEQGNFVHRFHPLHLTRYAIMVSHARRVNNSKP